LQIVAVVTYLSQVTSFNNHDSFLL